MFERLKSRIFYDIIDGKKFYGGGLLPDTFDHRDLDVGGVFGFFDYKPLHKEHRIDIVALKDQKMRNTCGWVSKATGAQARNNKKQSAKSIIKYAKKVGLLTRDGLSQLRDNMKAMNQFGICDEDVLPDIDDGGDFNDYAKYDLTPEQEANAFINRSASYWSINGKNEILKMLDEMKPIHTGSDWFNDYNMRGGFRAPFVIKGVGKYLVGGHAYECVGYDLTGRLADEVVLVFVNSYGQGYGDNGYFYVPMSVALKLLYSKWIELDITIDIARFLNDFSGKNVRGKNSRAVYSIFDGKKSAYPNWLTFLAYEGLKADILVVDDTVLDAVPRGEDMNLVVAPLFPVIKELTTPDNYKKLLELTAKRSTGVSFTIGTVMEEKEVVPFGQIMSEILHEFNS